MNKNNVFLLISMTSICSVVGALFASNGALSSKASALNRNGGSGSWHHYAAVAATENHHGSKEFWANDSDGCVTHTFVNPNTTCIEHDFFTYESFENLTFGDDRFVPSLFEQRNAVYPINNGDGTFSYGIYPQTNINDESLISSLEELTTTESNGWYLFEGAYYTKYTATPYETQTGYYFDNGTQIVKGTTYWFKCEPIVWKVLSNNNGDYYLLSSKVIDNHRYNSTDERTIGGQTIYPNNYEYSEIRAWLNDEFYNSAFALGNSYVKTTLVDNSASTTAANDNTHACNDTNDKVFFPSYQDYLNPTYGFSTSTDDTETRYGKSTDWIRAKGIWYSNNNARLYNTDYWTRSPLHNLDKTSVVWFIRASGEYSNPNLNENKVNSPTIGVRPAITLTLS